MNISSIELNKIEEPKEAIRVQPNDKEVKFLADSISKVGLINPITVKPITGNKFEVVAGHRRFLAAKILNLKKIDCNIITKNEQASTAIKITENISRRQITDYEGIIAIASWIKKYDLGISAASETLGIAKNTLIDYIVLYEAPDDIKMHLHKKNINRAVARELIKVKNTEARLEMTRKAIDYNWSKSSVLIAVDFYNKNKDLEENKKEHTEQKLYPAIERKQTFGCQMCSKEMLAEEIIEVFVCEDCREIIKTYEYSIEDEKKKMAVK